MIHLSCICCALYRCSDVDVNPVFELVNVLVEMTYSSCDCKILLAEGRAGSFDLQKKKKPRDFVNTHNDLQLRKQNFPGHVVYCAPNLRQQLNGFPWYLIRNCAQSDERKRQVMTLDDHQRKLFVGPERILYMP